MKRKILVIGAGGIGSYLTPLLHKTRLYDIHISDPDSVEEKNLFYQNFDTSHLDRNKVECVVDGEVIGSRKPFPILTQQQLNGFDLVVCCADNLDIRRTMYNSNVKWLDLRAQARNAAMISHLEDPKLYATFTSGPDGSFSCQGDSWEGKPEGVNFMQVVIAGYGAQWIQRFFTGDHVEKHFKING